MEVSYVGAGAIKIKTKTGSVVVDPLKLTMLHKAGGGEDFVITMPGEYEVEGISVFGYAAGSRTIYVVQAEDLRLTYLGQLDEPLSEKQISELENIDVVMLEVSGEGKLGVKEVGEQVAKLEPYYVFPVGVERDKFVASYEHGSRIAKSFSLNKLTLPEDLTEVIVLE